MRRDKVQRLPKFLIAISAFIVIAFSGCQQTADRSTTATNANTSAANGKIAITTSSEEARKEFLAGRDLAEKLRITDSIQHFDKAIALDPNFALAELNRANSSPTAKQIFKHLINAMTHAAI